MDVRRTVGVAVLGAVGAGWTTVGAAVVAAGAAVRVVVFLVSLVAGSDAVGVV
ncbi:MAG: hypothetical protein VX228_11640 [Pseudomonadota bacterium]|nr:hypothetical protein [Pseudomonadota bacterium]